MDVQVMHRQGEFVAGTDQRKSNAVFMAVQVLYRKGDFVANIQIMH